ncbi:MAG: nitroreductase family protein [Thaumarchaeota archaeon]|jgi:nitroreductase|nr:nitroreductase family protein [Nitrososphaerota archaeon]MBT3743355.1 nitroreductase family protein [Nitrososphaerota archaeon]MBT4057709.1 nitroreductase family protein [Nitrososphaerota archaeon]MBT4509859.1 nitroreductase family protein [Nitrososphaerota archaeon]MBT4973612.1 nitroreductase family protein [Nitrososphaerota archaeon]|tara:strand:+ start:396 stop:1049 length:654 start_codon:yes stop_codon:yes gene_type:complete
MDKKIDTKRTWPKGYVPKEESDKDLSIRLGLMTNILNKKIEKKLNTDIFKVMATRRSTRKFSKNPVEKWKIDKILAAADAAPTAGNFQGFEIFYISDKYTKEELVKAANKQPYVNTPLVLVFCMNPSRVKLDFPAKVIMKFSMQDATLAAAYSQLAASALGLSSIWIGMFDEERVKEIIGTELRPTSLLCVGYPIKKRPPKQRRQLKELIHVVKKSN